MHTCVICCGYTQCDKCKIKDLQRQLSEYKEAMDFFLGESSISMSIDKVFFAKKYMNTFECSSGYYKGDIPDEYLRNTYFITLTFDPDKFGTNNPSEDEENYILYILAKQCKRDRIFNIYGCFEQFKTGITHAHLIMHTNFIDEIRKELKLALTNNPRNRNSIDIGPAHKTKAIDYINKSDDGHKIYDPKKYFYYGALYENEDLKEPSPLDYGII